MKDTLPSRPVQDRSRSLHGGRRLLPVTGGDQLACLAHGAAGRGPAGAVALASAQRLAMAFAD
jgi:hypothetical protein